MRILSLVALLALLAGPALATPEAGSGPEHATLRVLVWNVLRGGNSVTGGPEKALKVIRDDRPGPRAAAGELRHRGRPPHARALDRRRTVRGGGPWSAHQHESPHLCVLTRLEIEAEFYHHPWHGVGARLTDDAGRSLVAYTIWLDYRSYITWDLRDDPQISDADLLKARASGRRRLPQARRCWASARTGHLLDRRARAGRRRFQHAEPPGLDGGHGPRLQAAARPRRCP
jgi:hypothetical protein